MRSAQKFWLLFIVVGLIYMDMEIIFRSLRGVLVGYEGIKWYSLAGWTSIWMIVVGGFCGITLGSMNEFKFFKKIPYIIRAILGMLIIFAIELVSGLLFNTLLKMQIWDYSTLPLNLKGQISIVYAPLWFILTPFVFWFDDMIRYCIFVEDKPSPFITYYTSLFSKSKYINQ